MLGDKKAVIGGWVDRADTNRADKGKASRHALEEIRLAQKGSQILGAGLLLRIVVRDLRVQVGDALLTGLSRQPSLAKVERAIGARVHGQFGGWGWTRGFCILAL